MFVRIRALVIALTLAASTPALAATSSSPATPAGARRATAAPSADAPAQPTPTTAATPASDDAVRYAARETKAKKQSEYEGGSLVVIGVSTGALIVLLLIVLIVL